MLLTRAPASDAPAKKTEHQTTFDPSTMSHDHSPAASSAATASSAAAGPQTEPPPPGQLDGPIRHHVYDGIAEYDKRLPNWWLLTFYGAIAFAIIYWMATQHFSDVTDGQRAITAMQQIEAIRLSSGSAQLDDEALWKMSRNPAFVQAGEAIFKANCVACHGADLKGGIGVNLVDDEWLHGGKPTEVVHTITNGVIEKGMQAWGPVLGPQKIAEAAAFIMSHHQEPAAGN
ncbi:cytochrome C oxidase subunit III [Opitutaceae bacterium TAV5]|nr:cytochrome C oxidase subunit III [Opitutaceae bacterium TAV5]